MKCTDNQTGRSAYTEREWARIQAKEKQENRKHLKLYGVFILMLLLTASVCFLFYYYIIRSHDYELRMPYAMSDQTLGIGNTLEKGDTAEPFAQELCVATGEVNTNAIPLQSYSAGLFNLNNGSTEYAKSIFERRSPASITKIMTALLTLKYGNLDEKIGMTEIIKDIEFGSSVCDVKVGDVLSLRQLLYGMMVASGNDAAMMIAEHIGGSVDNFVNMMNEEAMAIGATHTHFSNPHGLTANDHYTTVYDIYLIFHEALKYDLFSDIISRKNYYAEYNRGDGSPVAVTWESTNHYFTKEADPPNNVFVYGGKTGTTDDAGACLALLAKDQYGNPYIAIILHASDKELLYDEMNELLSLVND